MPISVLEEESLMRKEFSDGLERGALISADGRTLFRNKGTLSRVMINGDKKDCVLIHSHPKGEPPSITDFISALSGELKELRVVAPGGTYVMRFPEFDNRYALMNRADEMWQEANQKETIRLQKAGKLKKTEAIMVNNPPWEEVAKEMGFKYSWEQATD